MTEILQDYTAVYQKQILLDREPEHMVEMKLFSKL